VSYRPMTDTWILARTKLKPAADGSKQSFYGAYPAGFLHRARQLLGVRRGDHLLHVCGGLVKQCLYRGFEENDRTLDLDPKTEPDYLMDARRLGVNMGDLFPNPQGTVIELTGPWVSGLWPAIMIDRPYTEEDHAHYDVPRDVFPSDLNDLVRRALECVEPGGRVGVLDYLWPSPPTKLGKEVAVVGVGTGRNNRARWYTVFERRVDSDAVESDDESEGDQVVFPVPPGTLPAPLLSTPTDKPRRRRKASANVDAPTEFACPRCGQALPNATHLLEGIDGVARCGPCHRLRAINGDGPDGFGGEDFPSDPIEMARMIEDHRRSRGMTAGEKAGVLAAVKANVCHGCQEGLLIEGMETTDADAPNKWHAECWAQAQRRQLPVAAPAPPRRRRSTALEDV